jgi:hypothetical protein
VKNMATTHVYIVGSSLEETRPQIDYTMNQNREGIDWGRIGGVLNGRLPVSEYLPVRIKIDDPDAEKWDFYRCGGTRGLISARAAAVLSPHSSQCFDLMEAYINESQYFFLRVIGSIDCLDREHSILEVFPHDPNQIMWIERYAFHKSVIPDPRLFALAEFDSLVFGTDSIEQLIRTNKLRGFRLVDAEAG